MAKGYKHQKLWATTASTAQIHDIYVVPHRHLGNSFGRTDGVTIWLSDRVLRDDDLLEETLMHEFVHVAEHQCGAELKRRNPNGCTQAAIVFGRELSVMWRKLKRV